MNLKTAIVVSSLVLNILSTPLFASEVIVDLKREREDSVVDSERRVRSTQPSARDVLARDLLGDMVITYAMWVSASNVLKKLVRDLIFRLVADSVIERDDERLQRMDMLMERMIHADLFSGIEFSDAWNDVRGRAVGTATRLLGEPALASIANSRNLASLQDTANHLWNTYTDQSDTLVWDIVEMLRDVRISPEDLESEILAFQRLADLVNERNDQDAMLNDVGLALQRHLAHFEETLQHYRNAQQSQVSTQQVYVCPRGHHAAM